MDASEQLAKTKKERDVSISNYKKANKAYEQAGQKLEHALQFKNVSLYQKARKHYEVSLNEWRNAIWQKEEMHLAYETLKRSKKNGA